MEEKINAFYLLTGHHSGQSGSYALKDNANYYKCSGCGYEFLGRIDNPACPKCKNGKLESLNIRNITGMDG
jgi:rubrerythrin